MRCVSSRMIWKTVSTTSCGGTPAPMPRSDPSTTTTICIRLLVLRSPGLRFLGFPRRSTRPPGSQNSGLCCGRRANSTKGTSSMAAPRILDLRSPGAVAGFQRCTKFQPIFLVWRNRGTNLPIGSRTRRKSN
uniref:Uncharacterized protein n=1 Tax=Arundo donax TaxID=35708 RepID=A0A0A8YRK2_ARUDO